MKTRTINKIKVKVFEEYELLEKLGLSKEECDLILEYQDKFPELLQDDKSGFVISTKLLHNQLLVGRDYSTWIKSRMSKYNFNENIDYTIVDSIHQNGGIKNTKGGDRKSKDYFVTLEVAKMLSLVENNDIGLVVRKYFMLMEKTLRNYESWNVTRGLEKDGWNDMKEQIKQWCIRKDYDYMLDIFYIREANSINESLTGLKACEIKAHLGYSDNITRDHLEEYINKAINELQKLNISLLMSDLDFEFRKNIIKTTCENKYPHLYIKQNKVSA